MHSAPNLVLVGPMGSGKSSIGRRLADRLRLDFVDADREIEQRTGATVTMIFECEGEAGFRERERATLADLMRRERMVLATGGGAVLDAGTRALLRARGYVVHLQVGAEQQLARLARDRTRPLLAGDDRAAVLARLAAQRAPLYADAAHLRFDTDALSSVDAATRLGHLLDSHWHIDAAPADGESASATAADVRDPASDSDAPTNTDIDTDTIRTRT